MREAIAVAERLGERLEVGVVRARYLGEGGDGERFGKGAESVVGDVDGAERETREGSLGEGLDPVVVQLEALEDGEAGDGVGEDGDVVVGGDERDELARLPPRGGGGGGVEADGLWWGTRGRGRRAGVTERECVGWDRAEASPAKVQDAAGTSGVERLVHRLGAHRRHRGAIRGCASRGGCAVKWSARPTMGCPPSRFLRRLF